MTRVACHSIALTGLMGALALLPDHASAQGSWSLSLFVNPFPSPYASDWETNQTISSLTIVNPGGSHDVRLAYQVTNTQGRVLASGHSDPLGIPPGAPTVLTSIIDIAGASRRDPVLWDQMERTGRIPEGTYQACVVMASGVNGLVLGEDCATFTIVYPDSPHLIAPAVGEVLTTQSPMFQWTPVQVPPAYPVQYVLQVAELRPEQTAYEALNSGIPHYQQPDLGVTNLQYPPDAQPFEPGKRYAWRVVAIDASGFPPAANGGLSEIGTFTFDDGSGTNVGIRSSISLTLTNEFDTVDTASYVVTTDTSVVDVGSLCAAWHRTLRGVTVSSSSPLGLRRFAGQPAVLFRDSTAMKWWIATTSPTGTRSVLIGGDCLAFKEGKTRLRWIASRDSSLQHNITTQLSGGDTKLDSLWGFVVLSLGKGTVEVPEAFVEGRRFLRDRTLDVAPGLNTLLVLDMKEWKLWPFFQRIGYQEKEIEIRGFLGWDATWHIGGAVGDKAGVDLSTERKFLVLEAALPKRKPQLEFFKRGFESSQISFEVSVGDSIGRGFTLAKDPANPTERNSVSSYSFDVVGKAKVTFTINENLALVGSIGFDVARETERPILKDQLARAEWLRGAAHYATPSKANTKSAWIARHLAPAEFDEPEVNTDIVFGLELEGDIATLFGSNENGLKLDGVSLDFKWRRPDSTLTTMLSATAGLGGIEGLFKFGASYQKDWKADPAWKKDEESMKKHLVSLQNENDELIDQLSAFSMPLPDCVVKANKDLPACKVVHALRKNRKEQREVLDPDKPWRVRVSAGHLSIGEVLDLLKPLLR